MKFIKGKDKHTVFSEKKKKQTTKQGLIWKILQLTFCTDSRVYALNYLCAWVFYECKIFTCLGCC